jgi:hypothetical protein
LANASNNESGRYEIRKWVSNFFFLQQFLLEH